MYTAYGYLWDSRIVAPSAISASAGLVGWLSCGEPLIHCSNSLPLNTQPHLCDEEGSSARLLIGSLQAVANNVKGGRSVLSQMRRRAGETIKNHSRMQVCQLVHAIHFLSTFESTRLDVGLTTHECHSATFRPAEGQPAKEGEKPAVSS
jgi:hypothetical protein